MHAAGSLEFLRVPPGNRLEALKGNRAGQYSIRINDQFSVCFRWFGGHAEDEANRFGGSQAQRDMFSWTLTEAAIRLGDRALAEAFVAERLSWKPESPVNRAWAIRADKLKRKQPE